MALKQVSTREGTLLVWSQMSDNCRTLCILLSIEFATRLPPPAAESGKATPRQDLGTGEGCELVHTCPAQKFAGSF